MAERQFSIERLKPRATVFIRGQPSLEEAPTFFDRSYTALFAHVAANGGQIAGPAFSCTHARNDEGIDVEVALPLREPIAGSSAISTGEIPSVDAAVTYHIGSYKSLEATYAALAEYVREQGREPTGLAYEFYVDDPGEVPVAGRRTRIALPLRE